MSSEFGRTLRVGVFGQAHGAAIGVTVDGCMGLFPSMRTISMLS